MQYRKPLLTLLSVVLGYKLMTFALPLMNNPSDLDLYMGGSLLIVSLVGTFTAVWLLWRRS